MNVALKMKFSESGVLLILQALAEHNAALMRSQPELPLLYDSCVVYKPEDDETFSDYPSMLQAMREDCDSLAAARAGELMARGWKALRPGEGGYETARRLKPASIPAQVLLTTRTRPGEQGLYHCITRYWVNGQQFQDDPSARLGMNNRPVDPSIARSCHLVNLQQPDFRWLTVPARSNHA